MRQKLAVALGLIVLAASIMLGAGAAGAKQVLPENGLNVPGVGNVNVQLPDCANGADDDGDGLIDLADPGCLSSTGTSEYNAPATTPTVPDPVTPTAPTPPETGPTGPTGGGGQTGTGGGKPGDGGSTTNSGIEGDPTSVDGGLEQNDTLGNGAPQNTTLEAPKKGKGNGGGTPAHPPAPYNSDGSPTLANPSATFALFGPAPIGVPNFVIDSFEIPPFLLPIYQACGTQYGIPWQVLASINRIETAFGTNLNVSTAGAMGWMQFIPSSWAAYGVDANGDGRKDPYNPVDGICAAARYLRAAGGDKDIRSAIFAYNHADWYVDEVILYAQAYGKLPEDLVSSLTGLTEGAHFPVAADARYADDISTRLALKDSTTNRTVSGNAADVINSSPTRRGINIFSRRGAPIVAVNDGIVKAIGNNEKMGKYVVIQDSYGNRYIYSELGSVETLHPVPKPQKLTADDFKLVSPPDDDAPTGPATDTTPAEQAQLEAQAARQARDSSSESEGDGAAPTAGSSSGDSAGGDTAGAGPSHELVNTEDARRRISANAGQGGAGSADESLGTQVDDLAGQKLPGYTTFRNYFDDVFKFNANTTELLPLRIGSKVVGGTVIGRMSGPVDGVAPHINFAIKPAGRGAPRIDPKPILDGWKLLEATAIYRAAGKDPFDTSLGAGSVLLLSKEDLIKRVLSDPALSIYSCGRTDIASGQIDRRILAAMEYLVSKGFQLTITSLKCGHSYMTASGNVSEHTTGGAMDIAAINGVPVTGHQGPGGLPDAIIKALLELQGNMAPHQIISLEDLPGPQSFALADHYDHVHVGYSSLGSTDPGGAQFVQLLRPDQWERLIDRLGDIEEPTVPVKPSDASIPVQGGDSGTDDAAGVAGNGQGQGKGQGDRTSPRRSSAAHLGE